jgi:hypothetical protein
MKMNWSFVKIHQRFIVLGLFGFAMGTIEAITVVYLRQIYYPQGFDFPFSQQMLSIESLRESATMIMLISIGILAGKNSLQRFAYFLYTFAIWDIFYYVWLKLLLNWPSSLLTWDVLFLIPVPWIGPVLAPILTSLTMIMFGGIIICLQEKGYLVKIKLLEWSITFLGAFLILLTFIWDYSKIIVGECLISDFATLSKPGHFCEVISHYKPTHYNWPLFFIGEILILCAIALIYRRTWGDVMSSRSNIDSVNQ